MKTEKTQNVEQSTGLNNSKKTQIYNLIVLDASGSMNAIYNAVIHGFNDVLDGVKKAEKDFAEDQQHFLSLVSFNSDITKVIDRKSPSEIKHITSHDYTTSGCTALYDAMGSSLTELEAIVDSQEDAVGAVTVITDGYENASRNFTLTQIVSIIDRLKEKGWTFAFMGANQDVAKTTANLHIENSITFAFDQQGMQDGWERERRAKERYYDRMRNSRQATMNMSRDERLRFYRDQERMYDYFDEPQPDLQRDIKGMRVSPRNITHLNNDEVFVFGSNIDGIHSGGASELAYKRFGAIWGQGEGLQGNSYAIPTSNGIDIMFKAIINFIDFAKQHTELKFYVTAIGCGVSGYSPEHIAPLFKEAATLDNVYLPEVFLQYI